MWDEAEFKRRAVKRIKEEGGYGRRFEDQYAVGIADTCLIPAGGPVFWCEFKIIRHNKFGATMRQMKELSDLHNVGGLSCVPALVGCSPTTRRLFITFPTQHAEVQPGMIYVDWRWGILQLLLSYFAAYQHRRYDRIEIENTNAEMMSVGNDEDGA